MKILVSAKKNTDLEAIFKKELPKCGVVFVLERGAIIKQIEDAAVLIPERYKVDRELLNSAHNLKLIHCGTGYNNVDLSQARRKNILVATTPGVAAQSVAEHVFSLIHQLYKKISGLDQSMKKGLWNRDQFQPYLELCNKTLGLIGFGSIGKRVSIIAHGYGMKVLVCRRNQSIDGFAVELVTLTELLKRSDIISIHVPLIQETYGMIGKEELELMKNTSSLINTARGEVIDEIELAKALGEGKISGAGIDVYPEEPLSPKSPLRGAPNIVLTPHTAYYTSEALERRFMGYVKNVKRLITGEPLENLV